MRVPMSLFQRGNSPLALDTLAGVGRPLTRWSGLRPFDFVGLPLDAR